jgi:hypothetical protein
MTKLKLPASRLEQYSRVAPSLPGLLRLRLIQEVRAARVVRLAQARVREAEIFFDQSSDAKEKALKLKRTEQLNFNQSISSSLLNATALVARQSHIATLSNTVVERQLIAEQAKNTVAEQKLVLAQKRQDWSRQVHRKEILSDLNIQLRGFSNFKIEAIADEERQ